MSQDKPKYEESLSTLSAKVSLLDKSRGELVRRLWDIGIFDIDPENYIRVSEIADHIMVGFKVTLLDRDNRLIAGTSEIPNPQFVKYGEDARFLSAPEVQGYSFIGYVPSISNITHDLTSNATYAKLLTLNFKYNSDNEYISSYYYPYDAPTVQFLSKERPYYTLSGYLPYSHPSCIVPLTSNYDIYLNDIKNTIRPQRIDNVYRYDGKPHALSVVSVITYPINVAHTVEYSNDGSSWSQYPISKTEVGSYDIQYRLSANNFQPYVGAEKLYITNGNIFTVDYYTRNYYETRCDITTHMVSANGEDIPPSVDNTISSIFKQWSSNEFSCVTKDLQISAEYYTKILSVYFFEDVYRNREYISCATVEYNQSPKVKTMPTKVGWQNEQWLDENGEVIGSNTWKYVTHNISAYANRIKEVIVSVECISDDIVISSHLWNKLSGESILSGDILDVIGTTNFSHFKPSNWNPLSAPPVEEITYQNISAYYDNNMIAVTYYDNIPTI